MIQRFKGVWRVQREETKEAPKLKRPTQEEKEDVATVAEDYMLV